MRTYTVPKKFIPTFERPLGGPPNRSTCGPTRGRAAPHSMASVRSPAVGGTFPTEVRAKVTSAARNLCGALWVTLTLRLLNHNPPPIPVAESESLR